MGSNMHDNRQDDFNAPVEERELVKPRDAIVPVSWDTDHNSNLNGILMKCLECPVCHDVCYPPIFTCANGHNVCKSCQPRQRKCPVCNVAGRPVGRCLTLEKIMGKVRLPCKNKGEGCSVVLDATQMAAHWKICKTRYLFNCEVYVLKTKYKCSWKGNREDLLEHVRKTHPMEYTQRGYVDCDRRYPMEFDRNYTMLVFTHGDLFWVVFKYDSISHIMYLFVLFVGSEQDGRNYSCVFKYGSSEEALRNVDSRQLISVRKYNENDERTYVSRSVMIPRRSLHYLIKNGYFNFAAEILENPVN